MLTQAMYTARELAMARVEAEADVLSADGIIGVEVRARRYRHKSATIRALIASRSWLTVFYLPTTVPELNPVEGVWAAMKSGLVNLVKRDIDQIQRLVKQRLRLMQYRPDLLTGLLAKTGLDPQPP